MPLRSFIFSLSLLFFLALPGWSQDKPAYILYNAKGKKVSYKKMLKFLKDQEVLLIGELHNNPISHWMELEITKDLSPYQPIILGAEMFERDNQTGLDLYLNGKINAKGLDTTVRLWRNYSTDYAPLLNLAKERKWPFIASNVPRKYASQVARGGFQVLDNLSELEKTWLAPLPIAYDAQLPGYQKMLTMMGGHASEHMPKAQALKDATMAHSILRHWKPGTLFIHYNGSYHSEYHEGIVWYLRQQKPQLKIATIATVSQANIGILEAEHLGKADFILCVEDDMTGTY